MSHVAVGKPAKTICVGCTRAAALFRRMTSASRSGRCMRGPSINGRYAHVALEQWQCARAVWHRFPSLRMEECEGRGHPWLPKVALFWSDSLCNKSVRGAWHLFSAAYTVRSSRIWRYSASPSERTPVEEAVTEVADRPLHHALRLRPIRPAGLLALGDVGELPDQVFIGVAQDVRAGDPVRCV